MASSNSMPETRQLYLDKLAFSAVFGLLRIHGLKKVIVLEAIKPAQKAGRWLLGLKGVHVTEASFFAGHLKTPEGESVFMAARKLSRQIAFRAAREIVDSQPYLRSLNEKYGRNTIHLFIVKILHVQIVTWAVRVLVAQALCKTGRAELWLEKPLLFGRRLLVEAVPGVDLHFYSTAGSGTIKLAKSWILDAVRDMELVHGTGRATTHPVRAKECKPSVLMIQEDNIRADLSLRGQPHWVDTGGPREMFDTYVVSLPKAGFFIAEDARLLSNAGVTILSPSVFRYALRAERKNKILQRVRRDKRGAFLAVFKARGPAGRFLLLRVAFLIRQAELMGALALWLNVRVYLTRETYYTFADAMHLVASDLNVSTIAYQYSNLGIHSPRMITTADKFLIFSDMYKELYLAEGIAPGEFLPVGYLYDGIAGLVREKAQRHRGALMQAGATFIVCYFDESVQHDRWGMVSKGEHLGELHALAEAVLSDRTFGVVVKSQFMFNSPSQLYPGDELIRAAKATGRYFELMEGRHRNDIYPTEAALVADLCIGHKFGATAALEAAIAGVRTVILDPSATRTLWDGVYSRADIEYETMDSLMSAVAAYRAGSKDKRSLGDWKPILNFFDPYLDGKSADRLRSVLKNSI